MDYSELSFALEVRRMARERMSLDINKEYKDVNKELPDLDQLLIEMRKRNLVDYVEAVVEDLQEVAVIIKNMK